MPNPPTPTALSLTPITEGIKPGGGKKRQRPQSTAGAATPQLEEHGLRNYALRVCNIVQSLRETTYAHVADTLVDELTEENPALDPEHDGRNIRRCTRIDPHASLIAGCICICMPCAPPFASAQTAAR